MHVQPELPPSYNKNISLYVRRRTVCLCCGADNGGSGFALDQNHQFST